MYVNLLCHFNYVSYIERNFQVLEGNDRRSGTDQHILCDSCHFLAKLALVIYYITYDWHNTQQSVRNEK